MSAIRHSSTETTRALALATSAAFACETAGADVPAQYVFLSGDPSPIKFDGADDRRFLVSALIDDAERSHRLRWFAIPLGRYLHKIANSQALKVCQPFGAQLCGVRPQVERDWRAKFRRGLRQWLLKHPVSLRQRIRDARKVEHPALQLDPSMERGAISAFRAIDGRIKRERATRLKVEARGADFDYSGFAIYLAQYGGADAREQEAAFAARCALGVNDAKSCLCDPLEVLKGKRRCAGYVHSIEKLAQGRGGPSENVRMPERDS